MKKIISVILAVAFLVVLAGCNPAETPDVKSEGVMTHAQFLAAEKDAPVVIEAYVQAKQSWWDNKASLYVQDKEGGYFIYNAACTEELYAKLVPGTKIKATGFKAEWQGLLELAEGATIEIEEGNYVAKALDVTAKLGTDELINYQNDFVSFKGMTVVAKDADNVFYYDWDNSGVGKSDADLYFDVSVNGKTYTFVIEYYLCNENSDAYKAVKELKAGDVIDLEGYLYWYNGPNPHITKISK